MCAMPSTSRNGAPLISYWDLLSNKSSEVTYDLRLGNFFQIPWIIYFQEMVSTKTISINALQSKAHLLRNGLALYSITLNVLEHDMAIHGFHAWSMSNGNKNTDPSNRISFVWTVDHVNLWGLYGLPISIQWGRDTLSTININRTVLLCVSGMSEYIRKMARHSQNIIENTHYIKFLRYWIC